MMLIADSGSTKTTWVLTEKGDTFATEGLNPHFTSDESFLTACSAVSQHYQLSTINYQLYFYGAGCGSEAQRERVKLLLAKAFPNADIYVETDLLGACRALCGHSAGLVGILGTGSNACFYDGRAVAFQPSSTGYILGDHGSANHVGRRLLQDYLSGVMPHRVSVMFHDAYPLTKEQFIDRVYHQPNANRFLASLAPVAVQHQDDEYLYSVVYSSLCDWHRYQLAPAVDHSACRDLSILGGFASRIEPILRVFAADHGLTLRSLAPDPVAGLLAFSL